MWNREKAIRLVGVVTKEYGKEIIAEGSKSVIGLEDHIDRMIAKILEVESDIVTVAREWRKVIERVAITEGIDKVKIILGQDDQYSLVKNDIIIDSQESKSDIEIVYQLDISDSISNAESLKIEPEENKILTEWKAKEKLSRMEEVQVIKEEKEYSTTSLN